MPPDFSTNASSAPALPPLPAVHAVRRLLAFLLGLAVSLLPLTVAAEQDPVSLVRATTGELFARVHGQRELLVADPDSLLRLVEQTLLPHVDLEHTSRLVLGKHWRGASAPQRERFMNEFRLLLLRSYSTAIIEFADVNVVYLDTRYTEDGRIATVRTRVGFANARPEVSIDYRLSHSTAGWKVFDVMVGGISLVTTYRTSFGNEVSRSGLDGLLRALENQSSKYGA